MSFRLRCSTSVSAPHPHLSAQLPVRSYPLTAAHSAPRAPAHPQATSTPHDSRPLRPASAPLYVRSAAACTSTLRLAPAPKSPERLLLPTAPATEAEGVCASACTSVTVPAQYSAATVRLGHKSGPTHDCAGPNGVSRYILDLGLVRSGRVPLAATEKQDQKATAHLVELMQPSPRTCVRGLLSHHPAHPLPPEGLSAQSPLPPEPRSGTVGGLETS